MKVIASNVYGVVVGVLDDGTPFTVDFASGPAEVDDVIAVRFAEDPNVQVVEISADGTGEESADGRPRRRRRTLDEQSESATE